jgi:two-component system capsular synthesis sensor histidine kinase RcsC
MPGLDGYGLAARLRAQGSAVPIIAITAHTTEEAHRRCREAGIDEVLTKPFSLAGLDAAIRRLARGKHVTTSPAATPAPPRPLPPAFHDAMREACAGSLSRIEAALESAQWTAALDELHSMKGAFLVGRMAEAAAGCARFEALVRGGERERLAGALGELERIAAQALDNAGQAHRGFRSV